MNSSATLPYDDSGSGRSREDVRRQFLTICESSFHGGPPPDVETFLADIPEPERSKLRAELESVEQSCRQRLTATVNTGGAATASMTATPDVTEEEWTVVYLPRGPVPAQAIAGRQVKDLPETVAGYEILGMLGRGAMGVVYKARQRGLKRLVALKMILSGEHASEHELARFRSEAEAVAHLQHPNIVQIYEVGEEQGRPFFSLEFVDGPSLDKKIKGTPMPPAEAARLVQQLAVAMNYAHEHGIIHRDLKPANVLLAPDGTPKIGDFGLAKRIEEDSGQTRTGAVLGTPSYMAPEQAEGKTKEVGPLSDQYSLGSILYELLTGRPPFKGSTILDTLQQVRTLEPVPPIEFQPGVPRDLETICLKTLQQEPVRRYASAGELAEDLRRFLAGEPILARPVGRAERLWRWCRRNPRVAGLTAAVVGLVVVWGVTSTALAVGLKVQKDKTDAARIEAIENEEKAYRSAQEARRQEGIAQEKKKESDQNAAVARRNHELAQKQASIAQRNEKRAKETAQLTVGQMIELGRKLHVRLSAQDAPEIRGIREEVLVLLKESLITMSKGVQQLGITNFGQAFSYQQLGDLLANLGAKQEALRAYQHSYDLIKRVADAEPDNDLARGNLGVMLLRLGDVALESEGDAWKARTRFTTAHDLHQEILRRPRSGYFKEVDARRILSHDDVALGRVLVALGQSGEARAHFAAALKFRQTWSDADPANVAARSYITESRMWLGTAASNVGDEKAMQEHFGEAMRLCRDLTRKYPKSFSFKADLADIQGAWGDALLRLGKLEEADKLFQDALENLQRVIDHSPDSLPAQQSLALVHERLGASNTLRRRADAATRHYQEALKLQTALLQLQPANVSRQAARALVLAHAGKTAEALAEATKVQQLAAKSPKLLLDVVRVYAVCAAADPPRKADLVKRALEALRAATAKDYRDAVVLQTDPDLQTLRGEVEFQRVIEAVKGR
jgi:tetratricopeptide (TPR) repeat protein/tRNA A-37 threonylcarbamoyl transferase component Bud32